MESNGRTRRQRWTDERQRKEPTLYDEWLNEEKTEQSKSARRKSLPLRGDTAAAIANSSAGTVRAVTPEDPTGAEPGTEAQGWMLPHRGTTSFERAFLPHTTTTIVGGPAAAPGSSGVSKVRKLVKDRDGSRIASHSPPSSRNGSSVAEMLARSSSKSNGHSAHASIRETEAASNTVRPRTRTLDERRRDHSPTTQLNLSRNRMGSVNMPIPTPPSSGAEYLASVPASTSPPSAPSISSLDMAGRRSISPTSSGHTDTMASSLPGSSARKILHLMKTLNGRMSGNVLLRRERETTWTQIYCYVQEDSACLMYEPRGGDGVPKTLISGLRGCGVRPNADGDTPYLEVSIPQSDTEIHLKLLTQSDFDSWYAALLHWQSLGARSSESSEGPPPTSPSSATPVRPPLPPRTSSARTHQSHRHRDRAGSAKSDRRKSVGSSLKEAPVIKIGKMIHWDMNTGYSNLPGSSEKSQIGKPSTARPQPYRMQSHASRTWRYISGQLRENGELKLHSDADNSLISVVQLSQLSRCAIQRLDFSVLEEEHGIAIYPQYTSNPANSQPGFMRPIFLSLESRVLYEVWFVLLRAFTIPQLYGPRIPSANNGNNEEGDVESMLATTTTDMFRMERTLSIKILEAQMNPPTSNSVPADTGFSGGHSSRGQGANGRPEQQLYYAEVLLDNETRAKTSAKSDPNLKIFWAEEFEFPDLPPVLSSASVVIKRRPPDQGPMREQHEGKFVQEAYGYNNDQHGGFTNLKFDVTCGKVEIYLQELEEAKEVQKRWPVVNMYNQRVGDCLIQARAEEGVILMARDYQPLSELLHRFTNGLTLQIAQMLPPDPLKQLSDCLLNIFQVSGKVADWMMALVEEEIDGIHKETPISRLRFNRRAGSEAGQDHMGIGGGILDREQFVRDTAKNIEKEANLLFRGNTLLTKALDSHMRRVGKEYLEESLMAKIREINDKDPDCEVNPSRVTSNSDLDRNRRRLLLYTQDVWKAILATKHRCPIEMRLIFRHIRACAEDRYGDFLRSVSYSSVSGFLFLRFFCPAILNPKLFGLVKENPSPRGIRTFMYIAKSLQTLGNMASFGTKEEFMEPMNVFLTQNRESFKTFIDDVCYVPTPLTASAFTSSAGSSPTYPLGAVNPETHLSYTTPMTIMQRLPPTSREGFPSLPYLIDQARAFAELVQLWLEATTTMTTSDGAKSQAEVMAAIKASEGDLLAFHGICTSLHTRTQECLSRAERAERPHSAESFKWEELIDQLQTNEKAGESGDDMPIPASFAALAKKIAKEPSTMSLPPRQPAAPRAREWDVSVDDNDDEELQTRFYDVTPSQPEFDLSKTSRDRPGSSGKMNSLRDSLRRAQVQSRGSDSGAAASASASASNVSSAVSSDTEQPDTTALPNYDREMRHRERREAAKKQIKQEATRIKEREKEKEKRKARPPIVSALRRKKERESRGEDGSERESQPSPRERFTSHTVQYF